MKIYNTGVRITNSHKRTRTEIVEEVRSQDHPTEESYHFQNDNGGGAVALSQYEYE